MAEISGGGSLLLTCSQNWNLHSAQGVCLILAEISVRLFSRFKISAKTKNRNQAHIRRLGCQSANWLSTQLLSVSQAAGYQFATFRQTICFGTIHSLHLNSQQPRFIRGIWLSVTTELSSISTQLQIRQREKKTTFALFWFCLMGWGWFTIGWFLVEDDF